MMLSTRKLAQGSTEARLQAPGAVPELQAFATAFNNGLDRIDALTAELQSANDNLAHELRTPLARIRGNLETFHDHIDNPTAYKAAADERGLNFTFEAPDSRWVLLDRQRINQAVANLLDNAFAYTPRGGLITLALSIQGEQAHIAVRDTGPGLTAADQTKIWQRYMRGSAASANTPGMGLGLSLVQALAHAHNGSAGCRNLDECGAEFWIDLPAGDPLATANVV